MNIHVFIHTYIHTYIHILINSHRKETERIIDVEISHGIFRNITWDITGISHGISLRHID